MFPVAARRAARSRAFCFTWQNPTDEVEARLLVISQRQEVEYLIYGREIAPTTGTPHLQGYVVYRHRMSVLLARTQFEPAHIEVARGSALQNREYCSKEGDFIELGDIPADVGQGRRTDIERYIDYLRQHDGYPSEPDIMLAFPSLWLRYSDKLLHYRDLICEAPPMVEGEFNEWQTDLAERLGEPPEDDRAIEFIVDPIGGAGKSWFIRKLLSTRKDVQMLSIGKRDDLAYAVDVSKKIFLVSVPRLSMEYLNYAVLEMIKDRLIFSPKYQSQTKRLNHRPHVVVFSNERPNFDRLTDDRYRITQLSEMN